MLSDNPAAQFLYTAVGTLDSHLGCGTDMIDVLFSPCLLGALSSYVGYETRQVSQPLSVCVLHHELLCGL